MYVEDTIGIWCCRAVRAFEDELLAPSNSLFPCITNTLVFGFDTVKKIINDSLGNPLKFISPVS